ncbi:MAG: hypothetical protein SFV15_10920 [Polyangiaceae bacterium]|nr:hypothetical protein [Polyangiaceae bacterium]
MRFSRNLAYKFHALRLQWGLCVVVSCLLACEPAFQNCATTYTCPPRAGIGGASQLGAAGAGGQAGMLGGAGEALTTNTPDVRGGGTSSGGTSSGGVSSGGVSSGGENSSPTCPRCVGLETCGGTGIPNVCGLPKYKVTITRSAEPGSGAAGIVAGGGLSCGSTCEVTVDAGTTLSLLASPQVGFYFSSWAGGGCGSDPTCSTSPILADTVIDAKFTRANVVFVTSSSYTVSQLLTNGAGNPQAGADKFCQTRAAAGSATMGVQRTWISLITLGDGLGTGASARLTDKRGWVRTDGNPVGQLPGEFIDDFVVYYPPALDENGVRVSPFTDATLGDGCARWTSTAGGANGDYRVWGVPTGGGGRWDGAGAKTCDSSFALYCASIDYNAMVRPSLPIAAQLGFLTDARFVPGGGLAAADALCQQEAAKAAYPGTFKAFLASGGASALSRFTTSGPWYRPDGVLVGSFGDFNADSPHLLAPIQVSPRLSYYGLATDWAWTGAHTPIDTATVPRCTNWTASTTAATGRIGVPSSTNYLFLDNDGYNMECDRQGHLYCLQQ